MSIQLQAIFISCMLLAVVAFYGPATTAAPARVVCVIGLLVFLGCNAMRGIRRPVI